MSINIDLSRDSLFDDHGLTRLKDSYMRDEEKSPQERLAFVSKSFASNDEHAQRMYDYSSKHWLSYASPVLAFGKSKNGLPISCFLPYLHDSAEGLVECLSEVNWLSMLGGGIGIGVGIRSSDKKSVGIMPHMRTYDASCLAYRQGQTRRGSYATYLDINHPDIMMFLEMRRPTGDPNMRCLNLHHGVNITDDFMNLIEASMKDSSVDDSWELRDPDNDTVKEVVSARALWERIIDLRIQTGEPYLHFIDTSNRALNKWQKAIGLRIKQSNLCLTGETIIEITRHPVIGNIERIQLDDFIEKWNLGFYDTVFVRSYDQTTGSFCFKKILAAAKTADVTELIRIETEDGRVVECTPEHKIWTNNRGWVEAQDLKEDDDLITL